MHTSTNYIFIAVLTMILVIVIICGYAGINVDNGITFSDPPDNLWDLVSSSASFFFGMTFLQIANMPIIFSIFFWFLEIMGVWTFIKLVRGTD